MNSPQAQPHAYGEGLMSRTCIGLNHTYAGKMLPSKAQYLPAARIAFTFPLWGE